MAQTKFERDLVALLNGGDEQKTNGVDTPDDTLPEEEQYTELTPVVFESKESALALADNKDLEEDYKFARSNLHGLIGRTNASIELALKIAAMSEHPRAIEVVATLIKTSSDVTEKLLNIQKAIKDQSKELPTGSYQQVNNYYGNTTTEQGKQDPKTIDSELDNLPDD